MRGGKGAMSKLLFTGDKYIELDSMGVERWAQLILREFPLLEFAEFMGAEPLSGQSLHEYSTRQLQYLERCDTGGVLSLSHMNDVLARVPRERCAELHRFYIKDLINKPKDPAGREMSANVQKAMVFLVPLLVCECGAEDASYLYWAPTKSFKKTDILDWAGCLPRVSTGYDINTAKCAVCTPRLYPQVMCSREWGLYSTSDPSRCRCAACGG